MEAQARANLYGFFSRLFVHELGEAAAKLVSGPLGVELLPEFNASPEAQLLEDEDQRVTRFDTDFVHLTVVNVVPYASFYLRDDAMVEGGSSNPVTEFLKRVGFEVDLAAARSLAPDHIGILLEVMSTLCTAEAEAMARPDEAYAAQIRSIQQDFLREHVVNWAPVFLFAVERCAHTGLYREAARVAMDFIASDFEAVNP